MKTLWSLSLFLLAVSIVDLACGQSLNLKPPPPPTPAAVLTEYIESFPAATFQAAGSVVTLAHPVKVGTTVTVFMRGTAFQIFDAFKKTADPITLTLDASLVTTGAQVVFIYSSEQ